MRLEKVSGVKLTIHSEPELKITGESDCELSVKKAEKYCKCLIQQRKSQNDPKLMGK